MCPPGLTRPVTGLENSLFSAETRPRRPVAGRHPVINVRLTELWLAHYARAKSNPPDERKQRKPMFERYSKLASDALQDQAPSLDEARWILDGKDVELLALLQAAALPRKKYFGNKVMVQILNNVQNGACSEDCGYCSQSKDSESGIQIYRQKSDDEILAEAGRAARAGASRYCMAISGRQLGKRRAEQFAEVIRKIKANYPIETCLSAGLVEEDTARILADAGLDRLNHNLNTSESHYAEICSTHSYADRLTTLMAAKRCGLESCSGFILGMGESSEDILEVVFKLRELEVPSIPVNFLIPIDGNPVQTDGSLSPERCLRALALVRLVNPRAEIRAAAGREGHLRALEPLAFWAANSLFVEGYLTTRGDSVEETYRKIRDAGFEIAGNALYEQTLEAQSYAIPGGGDQLLKPEVQPRDLKSHGLKSRYLNSEFELKTS